MLVMSLRLIYGIADHRHMSDHKRNVAQTLTKSVINSLVVDTRRIAEAAAEYIGACLDTLEGAPVDLQGHI